jgi:hypothetical protein
MAKTGVTEGTVRYHLRRVVKNDEAGYNERAAKSLNLRVWTYRDKHF